MHIHRGKQHNRTILTEYDQYRLGFPPRPSINKLPLGKNVTCNNYPNEWFVQM